MPVGWLGQDRNPSLDKKLGKITLQHECEMGMVTYIIRYVTLELLHYLHIMHVTSYTIVHLSG